MTSEDENSTDSSLNEDAAAADAEASRRRTAARLDELEGAQQKAPPCRGTWYGPIVYYGTQYHSSR